MVAAVGIHIALYPPFDINPAYYIQNHPPCQVRPFPQSAGLVGQQKGFPVGSPFECACALQRPQKLRLQVPATVQRRGDLCGLLIGQAVREDWHAILGEPDETMTFTDSMAYDYGLPVGESDIYHFGEHELRLHADTDGVLRAVQLGK